MADVVVTMRIMPDSPERDLEALQKSVDEVILKFGRLYAIAEWLWRKALDNFIGLDEITAKYAQ